MNKDATVKKDAIFMNYRYQFGNQKLSIYTRGEAILIALWLSISSIRTYCT